MEQRRNAGGGQVAQGAAFDPSVIHVFAARLYRIAWLIAALFAVWGFVMGMGFGIASLGFGALGGAFIGLITGALGLVLGVECGFLLRLTAQMALCFVQIEGNTRPRS